MIELISAFWTSVAVAIIFGGLGYYVGQRGIKGVENDISNVKQDIANIKGKLEPTPVVVTP